MRLKNIVIALLILGPVIVGYFFLEKTARDGIAEREATERYLAANPPPKPIEIKIEGCPLGSWNTTLYGHVFVLDTYIEVPCGLSNGRHYLVGRQFSFQLSESVAAAGSSPLIVSVLFTATNSTVKPDSFIEPPALPVRDGKILEVELPKNRSGSKRAFFQCIHNACKARFVVAPNVIAKVFVHDERAISHADLVAVVRRVFSKIKSASME